MLARLASALLVAVLAMAVPAAVAQTPVVTNPCEGPQAEELLCPDLRVGPAEDLYVSRGGGWGYNTAGRVYLHGGNDIRSRGAGPMELRGHRYKAGWMRTNQAIYKVDGGVKIVPSKSQLHFVSVGYRYGGSYWKVHDPLSMEIWSLDEEGRPLARVRKGPKVFYCFRDLKRTQALPASPAREVYPACNQNPNRKHTVLGTSVGWSDIYPSTYDKQWVDVTGLRGCFAYVLRVDPENHYFESNERNNRSVRIIRLPYRDGPQDC